MYIFSASLPVTTVPTRNFQTLKFKMLKIKTLNILNKPIFTVLPLINLKRSLTISILEVFLALKKVVYTTSLNVNTLV